MEKMFIYLFGIWGIGMVGYITLNKASKYNNRNYYDISDKIIKYRRIKNKTNT